MGNSARGGIAPRGRHFARHARPGFVRRGNAFGRRGPEDLSRGHGGRGSVSLVNKYATLYGLSVQRQLEVRSDFLFERTRSISILVSLYFLWSALLANRSAAFGYERDQLLTYVFVMTILRAWVL